MQDFIADILQFLFTIAHWIGSAVASVVHMVFPNVVFPEDLVNAIGLLAIVTLFLILVQVAEKVARIIMIVAWGLILIRIIWLLLAIPA